MTDFDSEWPKLNPADFKYKEDVSSYLKKNYPLDVDGFMSDYSMESIREDKAELFSHMIVNMARVEQIARRDKSVAGKVERMKKLLLAFSPAFNDSFWATRHLRSVQGYLKTEFEDLLLPRVRKHN